MTGPGRFIGASNINFIRQWNPLSLGLRRLSGSSKPKAEDNEQNSFGTNSDEYVLLDSDCSMDTTTTKHDNSAAPPPSHTSSDAAGTPRASSSLNEAAAAAAGGTQVRNLPNEYNARRKASPTSQCEIHVLGARLCLTTERGQRGA